MAMVSDATHFLEHAAMCLRYLAGDDLLCTFWLNLFFFPGMHEALGMIGDDCCSTVEAPRSAPCSALQGASRCLISMACKECSVPIPGARQIVLRCAKHSSHVFAQHPKHPGACQQKSPRGTLITFRFFSCHIFSCASS